MAKSKKSLRFAYNGKKIKRSMVDADSSGKLKIKYRYKKTKPIINLSIKTCSLKSRAPVFIGHLDFLLNIKASKCQSYVLSQTIQISIEKILPVLKSSFQIFNRKITDPLNCL